MGLRLTQRAAAVFLVLIAMPIASGPRALADDRADLVLKGGRVIDGTGAPWYVGDIAVHGGKVKRPAHCRAEC